MNMVKSVMVVNNIEGGESPLNLPRTTFGG